MINLVVPTLIIAVLALFASLAALVLTLAQKFSTHQIEWKPLVTSDIEEEVDVEMRNIDEEDDRILEEALKLSKSKRKKDTDPLDDILETANYRS